jgi:hypothetical protein
MHTEGYTAGYLEKHSAPGGSHFQPAGYSVKSRESDAKFMVLFRDDMRGGRCWTDDMHEYARRWNGYFLEGDEREYYISLIDAIEADNGMRR